MKKPSVKALAPGQLTSEATGVGATVAMDALRDVEMRISVEVGGTRMPIRDILDLHPGSVVELDRQSLQAGIQLITDLSLDLLHGDGLHAPAGRDEGGLEHTEAESDHEHRHESAPVTPVDRPVHDGFEDQGYQRAGGHRERGADEHDEHLA